MQCDIEKCNGQAILRNRFSGYVYCIKDINIRDFLMFRLVPWKVNLPVLFMSMVSCKNCGGKTNTVVANLFHTNKDKPSGHDLNLEEAFECYLRVAPPENDFIWEKGCAFV